MARVPYADPEDVPEQHRDLLVSALQDRPLHVYRAVGNNPEVLAGLRSFLGSLWTDTGLPDRHREIVILTVAREIDNAYEWHQHVRIARGEGLSDEEIAAIGSGDPADLDGFDETETLLVAYVRAVVRGEVDDDLHEEMAARFDESTLVGIAALAEGYDALGGMIDAFDLELEAGEEFFGWDPRDS